MPESNVLVKEEVKKTRQCNTDDVMANIYTHLLALVVHLIASAEQFNLVEEFSILSKSFKESI